jgi:hypothetical protein
MLPLLLLLPLPSLLLMLHHSPSPLRHQTPLLVLELDEMVQASSAVTMRVDRTGDDRLRGSDSSVEGADVAHHVAAFPADHRLLLSRVVHWHRRRRRHHRRRRRHYRQPQRAMAQPSSHHR